MNNTQLISIREAVQASLPPTHNKRGRPSANITLAQIKCAEMAGVSTRYWQKLELGKDKERTYTINERSRKLLMIELAMAGVSIANTYQQSNTNS